MRLLAALLLIAATAAQTQAQCDRYVGRLQFLIDQSEIAKQRATRNYSTSIPRYLWMDVLREQLQAFSRGLTTSPRPVDVQLGAVSYAGEARMSQPLTTPANFITVLQRQSQAQGIMPNMNISPGGSHTVSGLQKVDQDVRLVPGYRNVVVVVSGQGTYGERRKNDAIQAANRLRAKGWTVYVIGIKVTGATGFNENELRGIANGQGMYTQISSYNELQPVLDTIRDRFLCAAQVTVPPTAAPTTRPTPSQDHPCAQCTHASGTYNVPHPTTCSRFYQCFGVDPDTGDYNFHIFDCGPGTLFNETDANCVWPSQFSCPAWGRCTPGRVAKFEHLCCGKYWECNDGEMTDKACPKGQVFRNGACVQGETSCLAKAPCATGTYNGCDTFKNDPNDVCKFIQVDPATNTVWPATKCPSGTGWNQSVCTCMANAACSSTERPSNGLSGNSGNDCKSRMHLSFDDASKPFQAIDDYTRADNGKWINGHSVAVSGGKAVFKGHEGTHADVIFIPFYANREFPDKWAMKLQFRFDQTARETEYVLLSNDRCTECVATVMVTARRSSPSSNDWTFTFSATDVHGKTASITARANIFNNQAGWSEVRVLVDGNEIRGKVVTPNGGNTDMTGSSTLTGRVQKTECGISIGQGRLGPSTSKTTVALDGEVDDFKFYECANLSNLL